MMLYTDVKRHFTEHFQSNKVNFLNQQMLEAIKHEELDPIEVYIEKIIQHPYNLGLHDNEKKQALLRGLPADMKAQLITQGSDSVMDTIQKLFYNILWQSIKEANQIYYLRSFEKFKHDIKQTWSIIDETLHRKRKNSLPRVFSHNGRILKEPVGTANAFNRYFINIGPSLANQIHTHHNYKE